MQQLEFNVIFAGLVGTIAAPPRTDETSHVAGAPGMGSASSTHVVLTTSAGPTSGTIAVSASSETFEGELLRSEHGVWEGAEILGGETGVLRSSSSLVDGFRAFVKYSSDTLRASMIGDLEVDGDYLVGESISQLSESLEIDQAWPIYAMAASAGLEKASGGYSYEHSEDDNEATAYLDGMYSDIAVGDVVIMARGDTLIPSVVTAAVVAKRTLSGFGDEPIFVPVTMITFSPAAQIGVNDEAMVRIWFNARKAGMLERIPTKTVHFSLLFDGPRPITATTPNNLPLANTDMVIEDAEGTALAAKGNLYTAPGGITEVELTAIDLTEDFSGELVKPITFHWGLTKVTRGETVEREILGDGDASQSWQSFTLAKSPLTYITDPYAPNGRRAELSIWVNGVKWRMAQSFHGAAATDEIYVVKHDEDHNTEVIFGDGELGSRLPTGPGNVMASYRFGVGANVDAKEINQVVKTIEGLKSVTNPLPATGGEDPPTAAEAREQAIQSTRVLGKLVSLPDFEVEASRFGGVLQAKAEWTWDRVREDAVAKVWIVSPGAGDPSPDVQAYLEARCEPGTLVRVEKAAPAGGPLFVDLEIDPAYLPDQVRAAVDARLHDDLEGLLAPRNAPIGRPLFRSQIYAAIHEIEGVLAVRGLSYASAQMAAAVTVPRGHYLAITKSGPNAIGLFS